MGEEVLPADAALVHPHGSAAAAAMTTGVAKAQAELDAEKQMELPFNPLHYQPTRITPQAKWDDVVELFGEAGRPVLHNGAVHESQPFAFQATLFYAYPNILFQVMKNGYIASVTLFSSDF
eukprot:TRINITY_DN2794_c0_g1_i4.p1 TRINITY_DN2794_c0_g1~~TRINITY_DN2794_c0_g1_i4.p1  ORF type:complete len:131 (-),score=43.76 TRINITY_DN2794_c0_g1_i4:373-735(-)